MVHKNNKRDRAYVAEKRKYDREHHCMLPDKIEDYAEDIAELLRVNDHQFFGCTRTYEIKLWEY